MTHFNAKVLLGLILLRLRGCGGDTEQRLNGGGSSFVYPMMGKWAAQYDKIKGIKVNYQSSARAAVFSR